MFYTRFQDEKNKLVLEVLLVPPKRRLLTVGSSQFAELSRSQCPAGGRLADAGKSTQASSGPSGRQLAWPEVNLR